MTDVEQPPQNGIDLSTEDDDNSKARPADIEQDMREMERRKRVEAIMGSKLFREELERIVDTAREGGASGILQQLSDMVGMPTSRIGNVFKASNCMMPINDIRGVESMGYAKGEKILRCKLAATFRLLDLYGWTQGLGAQITARLKVDQEVFLVNPYGLLYHEITASSLNKVDMQGQVVEQGTTNFGVNKNHFVLHSIVHAARPDIRCAIYIGCSPVVAVSSLKTGLLPITKDSCVLGEISTHPYTGSLLDTDERDKLVRNLGPNSKVMLLSNHGALCCGETIEEAFFAACHIVQACETQLKLLPVGVDNLVLIPEESRKTIYEQSRRPPEDLEKKFAAALANTENNQTAAEGEDVKDGVAKVGAHPKWRVGGAEFEALMRMLDNAGYRTGYIYRHPLVKSELPKPKNDVELPPAVSSLGYLLEEEELYRQGIWKKGDLRKGGDRSRWLNSPNVYQKVEVLETGTPDPKKITKWVAEGSPTHSTPVRIEDPLQFVPAGTNPREFKRVQQQIKDNRRADKISAGPQSQILDGVTWDEANRIKDATVSSAGDHVVLMGAASKGIIQRGFQHNATVYKAPYAKNPFDNVTDDELNEYKRTVERKKKSIHGEYTDTDFSESEALSSLHASAGPTLMKHTAAAVSQSEPEDASEHQVMRIETQQAPVPSQPEVVLSDATLDFINGERSHTATNKKPPTGRDTEETFQKEQTSENFQDPIELAVDAENKENLYAGNQNIRRSKELIAELKSDILFQRQREKLISTNSSCIDNDGSSLQNPKLPPTDDHKSERNCCDHSNCPFGSHPLCNNKTHDHLPLLSHCQNRLPTPIPLTLTVTNVEVPAGHVYYYETMYPQTAAPLYDVANDYNEPTDDDYGADSCEEKLYTKSIFCYTPNICESVFHSLQHPLENDLIMNIPFTIPIPMPMSCPPPTSAPSTPRKQRPHFSRSAQSEPHTPSSSPYRTVSHFGFNSPQAAPQPEHKHVPVTDLATKYVPLHKSISYEEIFSSPRYVDLCENCFEKIVRLKPELVGLRARLRNLVECPAGTRNDAYGAANFDYIDCCSVETTETLPAFPTPLEPVIEETSEVGSSEGSFATKPLERTISNSTFIEKISRMNYSEESANVNFIQTPRTVSSTISLDGGENLDKVVEDPEESLVQVMNDLHLNRQTENDDGALSGRVSFTEMLEFGNWQDQDQSNADEGGSDLENAMSTTITQISISSSNESRVSSPHNSIGTNGGQRRRLMSRDERNQRKMEFQELWEDHISFFDRKNDHGVSDTESAIDETTRLVLGTQAQGQQTEPLLRRLQLQEQEQTPEVFHGRSLVIKRLFSEPTEDEDEKSEAVKENEGDYRSDDSYSAKTFNVYASNENLIIFRDNNGSGDVDAVATAAADVATGIDPDVNSGTRCDEVPLEQTKATTEETLEGKNDGMPVVEESKDDDDENPIVKTTDKTKEASLAEVPLECDAIDKESTEFNSLERMILKKIEVNHLKETEGIFDKIENSIRNKLTPSKIELLVEKQKQLLNPGLNGNFTASTPSKPFSTELPQDQASLHSLNLSRIFDEQGPEAGATSTAPSLLSCSLDAGKQKQSLSSNPIDKFQTFNDLTKAYQDESTLRSRRSRSLTPRSDTLDLKSPVRPRLPTAKTPTSPPNAPRKSSSTTLPPMPQSTRSTPDFGKRSSSTCKRNFVLENIRNAAIPRNVKRLRGSNASSIFSKNPFGALSPTVSGTCITQAATTTSATCSDTSDPMSASTSPVYTFQSKLVRGSPRFWVSMSQTPTKKLQCTKKQKQQKRRKRQQQQHDMLVKSPSAISTCTLDEEEAVLNTVSAPQTPEPSGGRTRVEVEIDALGAQIQEVHPRLDSFKRKIDDYGEHVSKCARHIDECIDVQLAIKEEQKRLREDIVLNQYVEQIACQVQTFSISETED